MPLFFIRGRDGSRTLLYFSSLSILGTLGKRPKSVFGGITFPRIVIPLFFFVMALARPQWTKVHNQYKASGVDIIIAIDVSKSMEIADFVIDNSRQRRITAAKKIAKDFITKRPHDRIGVVAFAGRPYQVSPITTAHDWLPAMIDREVIYSDYVTPGTAIGSAIGYSTGRLDNKIKDTKTKIVILITDGSWNSGKLSPEQAAHYAKDKGVKVYTLAIGTETGRLGNHQFHVPQQEFDTETLKRVAEITEAKYFRAKTTEALEQSFSDIDKLEKVEAPISSYREVKEYHAWFTGIGAITLMFLLIHNITRNSDN